MAQITAALVKQLRDRTGAGMMDCKKALTENDGDLEVAVDWLRKKGLAAAAKKAGRVAAEGLVGVATDERTGALVEINTETDFVARNEDFQAVVRAVATLALGAGGDIAALSGAAYPGTGRTVGEEITNLVATIGENIQLRRTAALSVSNGLVAHYVHAAAGEGIGRIGVLVALESDAAPDALKELGRQLAMHVAASNPLAVTGDTLDPAIVERERAILEEQIRATGKEEDVVKKRAERRLRKYFEEVVLVEQTWVIDGKSKISKVLNKARNELGASLEVAGFARFQLGEGVEREEKDFAAEVAAQLGDDDDA